MKQLFSSNAILQPVLNCAILKRKYVVCSWVDGYCVLCKILTGIFAHMPPIKKLKR